MQVNTYTLDTNVAADVYSTLPSSFLLNSYLIRIDYAAEESVLTDIYILEK